MDRDNNYISPRDSASRRSSGYGRSVSESPSGYDMERSREEFRKKRADEQKKRESVKLKEKQRIKNQRIKAALSAAAILLIAIIVIFFTPMLGIQNVSCAGNSIVQSSEIESRLTAVKGKNLVTLSKKEVANVLSDLSYIEDVSVSKYLLPPSIRVNVTECTPAARIELNGYNVILDPQLKVLSDGGAFDPGTLPVIEGLSVSSYRVGSPLTSSDGDNEKIEILTTCLDIMNRLGMTDKIDYINIENKTDIRFGYDDRLDALCGGNVDLEHKIRMFNAVVTGNNLSEDAHGTIDLSTSGNAVYVS